MKTRKSATTPSNLREEFSCGESFISDYVIDDFTLRVHTAPTEAQAKLEIMLQKQNKIVESLITNAKCDTTTSLARHLCQMASESTQITIQQLSDQVNSFETEFEANTYNRFKLKRLKVEVGDLVEKNVDKSFINWFREYQHQSANRLALELEQELAQLEQPKSQPKSRQELEVEQDFAGSKRDRVEATESFKSSPVCAAMEVTLFDRVSAAAHDGAIMGLLKGATNSMNVTFINQGYSTFSAGAISQTYFYSAYAAMKFSEYYLRPKVEDEIATISGSILMAALDTRNILLITTAISIIHLLLLQASRVLNDNQWHKSAKTIRVAAQLSELGIFAYHTKQQGIEESTASLVAGSVTQSVVEMVLKP